MGQTILCEYLANWESTGIAPDPTAFGFASLYAMLEECQGVMLELGSAVNEHRRTLDAQHSIYYNELNARDRRIADLEAQVAALTTDVADWKAIAAEREKIATIAVQRYREIANAA